MHCVLVIVKIGLATKPVYDIARAGFQWQHSLSLWQDLIHHWHLLINGTPIVIQYTGITSEKQHGKYLLLMMDAKLKLESVSASSDFKTR